MTSVSGMHSSGAAMGRFVTRADPVAPRRCKAAARDPSLVSSGMPLVGLGTGWALTGFRFWPLHRSRKL